MEDKGVVAIKKYLCGDSVSSLDTKDATYNNDGEYLNIITPATINGYNVVGLDRFSFTARAIGDKVGVKSIKMLSGGLASYAIAKNEIEYLELSPTVDHLYSFVVRNNNHLKHVKLPTNFEMAGGPFFNNNIDTLEFENGPDNYKIADFSFEKNKINHVILSSNNITSIVIPSFINQPSIGVLSNNPLVSVTIPNSVTSIQDSAFAYTSIASITLPNNLNSIGAYVFQNSNLESITIPNSVNTINSKGLSGMSNFKTINIDKTSGSITGSPWEQQQL